MARSPMFLERQSYRARRMMDAVRFLPLLGLLLWMVPLLWPAAEIAATETSETGGLQPMRLSAALQYIFGIWVLLVLATWLLWRRTKGQVDTDKVPNTGAD